MARTLGFTGMDSATESALQAAFTRANAELGAQWRLLPDSDADYVIVDMDSMYGPMSWLRLHASGKQVIGLTNAPRTQTHFRLAQPVDSDGFKALLREIDAASGAEPSAMNARPEAPITPAPASPADTDAPVPAGMTPAPQPFDQLPEELPRTLAEEDANSADPLSVPAAGITVPASHEPPSAAVAQVVPAAPSIEPHVPASPSAGQNAPKSLADWLRPGQLHGRMRFERAGITVLIDADQQQYFGPANLKPLAPLFDGPAERDDFRPVDSGEWTTQSAALGSPQPLVRLAWYGALLAGKGRLGPGHEADARYQLLKWPQTEREFPKHFRIATAMMKGPITLAELAQASAVALEEVTDFVNANLVTGFAERYRESSPDSDNAKGAGLFGRLRGR